MPSNNTYYICGNTETLFSGETDNNGIGLETECLDAIDYSLIEEYCHENNLEFEVKSDFSFWNGGTGYHNSFNHVSVGKHGTPDNHLTALGKLLRAEIIRVVREYNELYS